MRRNTRNKNRHAKSNDKKLIIFLSCFLFIIILSSILIFIQFNNSNEQISLGKDNTISNEFTNNTLEENVEDIKDDEYEKQKKEKISFTLTAIGDVMCHNTQYWDAYNKETGEYDFSYVFEDIKYYTQKSDITVGSLETSFAGEERGYSNYPTFNSPDALAYSLKDIGIDVLSTAGNHCLDMGFSGLSRTIDVLDDADISHVGTYKTQEDRDKVLIKFVNGLKIAFINYTYGTNGIPVPADKTFCVNLIDKELIKKDIESAKSQNADVIIACMHWGTEYRTSANQEQKDLADFLFQNGVNVILGNHPHVLEPMEKRTVTLEDGSTRDGFVIYACGNFICDQNYENTRNSIILNIDISKQVDGSITIDSANYVPIYMYKDKTLSIKKMKLLDIETTLKLYDSGVDTSIGASNYSYLQKQLSKIKEIVGEEF